MELLFSHFVHTTNLVQQRELFKDCFPETNGEAIQGNEHYIWKFHTFPFTIPSFEYAVNIDSEMVGYYAAIPYNYKIGEKITPVGMVCDVMTSSRHRGKGIFTKMGAYSTSELSKSVPFTMGYPIRKEVIPGHLKVGWKIPFSMPLYIKFLSLDSLLKAKKIGFIASIANLLVAAYNGIWKTKYNKKYKSALTTNISLVKGYDEFAGKWLNSVPNALIKDLNFAVWRYNGPERNYQFISIYDINEQMVGFVSFRKIIKEGVPSFGILDYMVLPDFKDCHGLIIKVISDYAKKEKVEAILTMMSKDSARKYKLHNNGFLKSPFVFKLIIKNLTNEFSDQILFDEKNWHLMWVDSDDL